MPGDQRLQPRHIECPHFDRRSQGLNDIMLARIPGSNLGKRVAPPLEPDLSHRLIADHDSYARQLIVEGVEGNQGIAWLCRSIATGQPAFLIDPSNALVEPGQYFLQIFTGRSGHGTHICGKR